MCNPRCHHESKRERERVALLPPVGPFLREREEALLPPKIVSPQRFLPEYGSTTLTGVPLERFLELLGVCGDLRFDPAVES